MTIINDLQAVKLLSDLKDSILKKIERITTVRNYKRGDFIFKENQYADFLYAVITGKVALELHISSVSRCRVKDVYPTETFGISSIVDTGKRIYIADGIALQDSKVFCWRGNDLERLFYEDFELGFIFMRNTGKILKNRLQYTRAQLAEGLYAVQYQSA